MFHSDGKTTLDEALKEVVFSEIFGMEFPGGAVPVLAILDTGLDDSANGAAVAQRRCLVVRPPVLRAAHLERAPHYLTDNPFEGALDTQRVIHHYEVLRQSLDAVALQAHCEHFWATWAAQCAYGFIHRLSQGAAVTSNIALDGRLLDFGGCSAMPSWARAVMVSHFPPFGFETASVREAISSFSYYATRFSGFTFDLASHVDRMGHVFLTAHERNLTREFLRLAGLSTAEMDGLPEAVLQEVAPLRDRLFDHYRHDHFELFDRMPTGIRPWDVAHVWHTEPPEHLRGLAQWLKACVPAAQREGLFWGNAARFYRLVL